MARISWQYFISRSAIYLIYHLSHSSHSSHLVQSVRNYFHFTDSRERHGLLIRVETQQAYSETDNTSYKIFRLRSVLVPSIEYLLYK